MSVSYYAKTNLTDSVREQIDRLPTEVRNYLATTFAEASYKSTRDYTNSANSYVDTGDEKYRNLAFVARAEADSYMAVAKIFGYDEKKQSKGID